MKHVIKFMLTIVIACCALTACAGSDISETVAATVPETETQEQIVETVPFEELHDTTSPLIIEPEVPVETMPEKPDADYSLPPGENPGGVPQVK